MFVIRLVLKNLLRHPLRTILTIVGIAIAVMAFGLMQTVISAWNSGVTASAANRLVTVHSVSFINPLPLAYRDKIARVPGVQTVSYANWFSGIYIDENQFFARLAVDPETIFDVYPEFLISKEALDTFKKERNGTIIGQKIATQYNLKIGDIMNIEGDIYPGQWQMKVVGIYKGRDETIDETQMWFNWAYLNERVKETQPGREGQVGWYIIKISNPEERAAISQAVDDLFTNSAAETKTQTEKEFQQSFVSMSGAILAAINVVSFVIIGIVLLVLANTMVMTARERIREYAVMKTLGFSSFHLTGLIAGESMLIACLGGGLGLLMTFPIAEGMKRSLPSGWFPVFNVETMTVLLAVISAVAAGALASVFPIERAVRMKIVDGLRQVG